ncbi:MAG TPA: ABC transporter ATP-binding protein, partial [Anaerolineae bacterium]|nr:ABC transporter ATP-binding protein [Anaerolineae bacterium]
IFLLDEPLSNLDARLRMDMRSELKRLHRDAGATAIYVTHDQIEALTMSTHIAVLRQGRLCQLDAPKQVYRCPASLFVADFIGNPKVNLIEGTATQENGTTAVTLAGCEIAGIPAQARGPVVVAIRPEDVHLALEPVPGGTEFEVYSVLPAGSEMVVNVRRGNQMLTVKETRPINIEMDAPIWVTFDSSNINLYDKESGDLIPASA